MAVIRVADLPAPMMSTPDFVTTGAANVHVPAGMYKVPPVDGIASIAAWQAAASSVPET